MQRRLPIAHSGGGLVAQREIDVGRLLRRIAALGQRRQYSLVVALFRQKPQAIGPQDVHIASVREGLEHGIKCPQGLVAPFQLPQRDGDKIGGILVLVRAGQGHRQRQRFGGTADEVVGPCRVGPHLLGAARRRIGLQKARKERGGLVVPTFAIAEHARVVQRLVGHARIAGAGHVQIGGQGLTAFGRIGRLRAPDGQMVAGSIAYGLGHVRTVQRHQQLVPLFARARQRNGQPGIVRITRLGKFRDDLSALGQRLFHPPQRSIAFAQTVGQLVPRHARRADDGFQFLHRLGMESTTGKLPRKGKPIRRQGGRSHSFRAEQDGHGQGKKYQMLEHVLSIIAYPPTPCAIFCA